MNHSMLIPALLASLFLVACDRPTVINVPVPVAVPGPAGPQGATGAQGDQGNQGNQGNEGNKGATGKPGEGTTVIVVPPETAPAK